MPDRAKLQKIADALEFKKEYDKNPGATTFKTIEKVLQPVQEILGVKEELEQAVEQIVDLHNNLEQRIENKVASIPHIPGARGFKGDPGENYILTEKDKEEISKSIKVPVVEKVTVVKEQPVIKTEIVKETTISENIDGTEIINRVNKEDGTLIKKYKIEGLEDIERIAKANASSVKSYTGVSETRVKELISSTPAGASTFLALTDTPSTYSGQSTKIVRVKTDETGLEFVTPSSEADTLDTVTDRGATTTNILGIGGLNDNAGTPKLSIDPNTRQVFATNGSSVRLDWGDGDFLVKMMGDNDSIIGISCPDSVTNQFHFGVEGASFKGLTVTYDSTFGNELTSLVSTSDLKLGSDTARTILEDDTITLSGYATAGFVKTDSSGELSIDTNTYLTTETDPVWSSEKGDYFNKTTDDTDDITDTATNRFTNDTDITRLANTSGTNTGDQDLSGYLTSATASSTYLKLDASNDPITSELTIQRSTAGPALTVGSYSLTENTIPFNTGFYRGSDGTAIALTIVRAGTSDAMMGSGLNGDTFRRFVVMADGTLNWGSGSLARDTALYRSSADNLATQDSFNLLADSIKLKFGAGSDFEQYYTGTNMVFDPVAATSQIVFNESGLDTDLRVEGDTDANLLYVDAGSTGKVGIGVQPVNKLHIFQQSTDTSFTIRAESEYQANFDATSYGANAPTYTLRLIRGTKASQTAVLNGDTLGSFIFRGRTATTERVGGQILSIVEASPSADILKAGLSFRTNDGTVDAGVTATERVRITNTGFVGIGTASPTTMLEVVASGSNSPQRFSHYSGAASTPFPSAALFGSRGTIASPSALQTDDNLGYFSFQGRKATANSGTSAGIYARAATNWTDSSTASKLLFFTTPDASTTVAERMQIASDGKVGIGVTPSDVLHIKASSGNTILRVNRGVDTGYSASTYYSNATVDSAHPYWGLGIKPSSYGFALWSNDGSSFSDKLTITPDGLMNITGQVQIGTAETTIASNPAFAIFGDGTINPYYVIRGNSSDVEALIGVDEINSPNGVIMGSVTNHDFVLRTNNTERLRITSSGDLKITADSKKLLFGAGDDASITYDGTDLAINPREVGSGVIDIKQATGTAPATPGTVAAWLDIKINGTAYKMPLYQ